MSFLKGCKANKFVLKPIFSATAKASSVVPDFEHSFLNLIKSLLFSYFFEIGWSIDTAIKKID